MTAGADCFRLPRLLLPRAGLDLQRWCVIACDQYTSEPAYWARAAEAAGDAPSTLQLIYPEVFLHAPDKAARVARIQQSMREYLARGLLQPHEGTLLVERTLPDGRVRRGLMLELDLEHYDFSPASTSLIRPTEGTIVERLAPRIEVRREAELELPHILVLIDDPAHTVIGPLLAPHERPAPLYDGTLMLGGGRVTGHAPDAAAQARVQQAVRALADPAAFAGRHGLAAGTPPMLFAVGDGNHSLATAKACWQQLKAAGAGPDHPARWALVEVENIHDPALVFEPIHRLLFGVQGDLRQALAAHFGPRVQLAEQPDAAAMRAALAALPREAHAAGLLQPGGRCATVVVQAATAALDVSTFQGFVDAVLAQGGAREVDYVHGEQSLADLAAASGNAGLQLRTMGKAELIGRVARDGPLPRKSFSMGEADEKRFYLEARRIRPG